VVAVGQNQPAWFEFPQTANTRKTQIPGKVTQCDYKKESEFKVCDGKLLLLLTTAMRCVLETGGYVLNSR
jgi:hypothetical protein